MTTYGVIDMGSNTIRFVVYEVKDAKNTCQGVKLASIINDKIMASLASYIEEGLFTQAGIDRAVKILSGHLKRSEFFRCERLDIFATAVFRNAHNGTAALAQIEQRINKRITLLSGEDEARLGFVGASYSTAINTGVMIDIGGGSTEITSIKNGTPLSSISIKQGSLSSYEHFVSGVLPTTHEALAIAEAFRMKLQEHPSIATLHTQQAWGIGGSVRSVAKLINTETRPKTVSVSDVDNLLQWFEVDTHAFTRRAVKAIPERMHTAVPGMIILSTIMHELGTSSLRICKHGLREGYVLERMITR